MKSTHIIADLHVTNDRDVKAERLAGYLAGPARDAQALYVLGDLFDVWIGDDGSIDTHAATLDAFGALSAAGVPLYFIRGNRDFAVGSAFVARTGFQILDDPTKISLHGVPTLLAHGDIFCSDDTAHQAFRARYTDPRWRARRLALPLWLRRAAAKRARRRSTRAKHNKSRTIMDVTADTITIMAHEYGVGRIIHGHTHRPADHIEPGLARYVVADWRADQAEVLCVHEHGVARMRLDAHGHSVSHSAFG